MCLISKMIFVCYLTVSPIRRVSTVMWHMCCVTKNITKTKIILQKTNVDYICYIGIMVINDGGSSVIVLARISKVKSAFF